MDFIAKRRRKDNEEFEIYNQYLENINSKPIIKQFKETHNHIPETITQSMTDTEGLQNAYASPDKTYVFGDRMYIAGTSDLTDVMDDVL